MTAKPEHPAATRPALPVAGPETAATSVRGAASEPPTDAEVLPSLGERFELRRALGRGGMGVVYEALDREHGSVVALKGLRAASAQSLLLFKNEFRALQRVHHPNLMQLGELLEVDGARYFTMELVRGDDLLAYCRPDGVLAMARLRACLAQLVAGLSALHAHDMVHRDVKPSNVVVTDQGRLVVLDFGLVADTGEAPLAERSGTYAYMAPEQMAGGALSPAADWYAVGVVLFQALTGHLPFPSRASSPIDGPPPSSRAAGVPADLDELCEQLLRADPAARPTGAALCAALGVAHEPTSAGEASLVGRDPELRALSDALEAAAGGAVVMTVRGVSGLGKSALARHFAQLVRRDAGALVLSARCYERETVRYKAVDGVLDALARWLATLDPAQARALLPDDMAPLAAVFPVLAPWAEATERASVVDPTARRLRVFAALRALLVAIGRERRLVIAIDDMQWADTDSLALLRAVLRPPGAPRALVLLLRRPTEDPLTLPGVDARTLELTPLADEHARELAARLWAESGGEDGESIAALAREAGGHPLFLSALVRQARRPGAGALSLRLDDALHAEVERVEPAARALLRLLAVAGGPLTLGTSARALEVPVDALARTSAALFANRLVGAAGTRRDDALELFHDRLRETIAARLEPAETRACHRALAAALEQLGGDADALSLHWLGAGEPGRARAHLVRAADDAAAALAFVRAAELYARALPLFSDQPEAQRQLEARRGDVLAHAGHSVAAA